MKIVTSLLALFLFVALLVAACGPTDTTPEFVMDEVKFSNSQGSTDAVMNEDDSGSMRPDSESMMEADDSGTTIATPGTRSQKGKTTTWRSTRS